MGCTKGRYVVGIGRYVGQRTLRNDDVGQRTLRCGHCVVDIVEFYPSITEDLLDKAIAWARQFTAISDNDIVIIKHARKSLLFHKNHTWSKRNSNSTFDVTMGSYDGAEICELVGLFILNSLQTLFGKDVGLYRDDGLAVLNTKSGRLGDKARQDLTRAFNDLGLNITTFTNQQSTNFLDVTFDLTNNSYKPYRKPDNEPLYINHSSNHPPHILRELPKSINKRINTLSCEKQTFEQSAPTYGDALSKSNFNAQLEYEQQNNTIANDTKDNVTSFGTSDVQPTLQQKRQDKFSAELFTTDDKHFPPNSKLNKLFNKHTVRVSYSCNENMRTFISRHNKTILKNQGKQNKTKQNKRNARLQLQTEQTMSHRRQMPTYKCCLQSRHNDN